MQPDRLIKISKFLSYHLRHHPEKLGLKLSPGGWVPLELLLANAASSGFALERHEVVEVVARSDKQRFALNADQSQIRANQGHSTEVDLQLTACPPPKLLFHGTPEKFVDAIQQQGLKKMQRHHVHLSPDRQTARAVGARRGRPRIFTVAAATMAGDGYQFFLAENGVWLVDSVPARYLTLESP